MALEKYYIISDAQAAILEAYGVAYTTLDGVKCIANWTDVVLQIEDEMWSDGELTPEEGAQMDELDKITTYRYWSTELHSWVNV